MGPEVNCHEFTLKCYQFQIIYNMKTKRNHMNDRVSLKTTIMPFKKRYTL